MKRIFSQYIMIGPGASVTGCLILILTMKNKNIPSITLTLSVLIGLSLVFWVRNTFGMISVFVLGAAIFALHEPPLNRYAHEVLLFLAIQTALNALFDIRTLFSLGSSKHTGSDAHTLQKLFYLPYWFWAMAWLCISLLVMYQTAVFLF